MSILTLGGLLLIAGAAIQWRGYIRTAIWCWILADFCWIYNAWSIGDYFALGTIGLGATLGILTVIKMHSGIFHSNLKKDK